MNVIRPIDIYVIDSLLKENKITSDALLSLIQEFIAPTDFCDRLLTIINKPKNILQLTDYGISKSDCIKVLKQYLGISTIQAKALIDSLPALIDLDCIGKPNSVKYYAFVRDLTNIQAKFRL